MKSKIAITKLNKENITDKIYDILKDYISSKTWGPGYKLPSENELAEQFGVSRMSIRMVLQKLNAFGLVETKVGEGTFVKKFSFRNIVSEVSELLITPQLLTDINEFRKDFEVVALKLAIERASQNDFYELEKKFNELNNAETIEEYLECDFQYHLQICQMSKNSMYVLIFEEVREFMKEYLFANVKKGGLKASKINHKELFDAIMARDFKKAEYIYMNMINYLLVSSS